MRPTYEEFIESLRQLEERGDVTIQENLNDPNDPIIVLTEQGKRNNENRKRKLN